MKSELPHVTRDVGAANLSDLLAFYYDGTPAKTVASLLGQKGTYTLTTRILDGRGWRGRDQTLKNALNDLLTCYGVVEIAALAGFIPSVSSSAFWKQAETVLGHYLVRDYCAEHSLMTLPLLLKWRLTGTHITLHDSIDCAMPMIVFLDLDRRFFQLEGGVLLPVLDSRELSDLRFTDLLAIVREPDALVRSLLLEPLRRNTADQYVNELRLFLQFCNDLSDLLSAVSSVPVLRSAMWDRYSYWFEWGGPELLKNILAVCAAFAEWGHAIQDPAAKVEVHTYVIGAERAIRMLTDESNGAVIRNLLRELDTRADGTIDEDAWIDVHVEYAQRTKDTTKTRLSKVREDVVVVTGRFGTTRWSLVLSATDNSEGDAALNRLTKLCQIYWRPIFSFILRRGFDVNDAQDLTQDFFLSILEGDFLRQVDPNRGRFRSLLLKALQNFLNDVNERHRAKKRGREALSFVSWDDWMAEAPSRFSLPSQAIESWPPERLFDVRWAATVVEKSLRRLREECEARGRRRVFDSLSSSLSIERSDISYEELGKTLGVSSTVVKRLVFRLRQRYAALLREEVSATVAASENVDEELRYLCATLAAHEDEIAQIQSGLPIGAGSTSNIRGIPDSVLQIDRTCPRCGVTARVVDGKCLSCLLPIGLERQATEAKSFGAVLEETGIRDIPWRFGNYQVLEEIGRGSMGVIYRARQRHSKRIVALKRILSDLAVSSGTLERFRRETEAAAALDHPNIVPIYEIGEVDGLPFFTMKHATGGTLQSAARASLRNDPQHCVRLVVKIAHAIAYAHREGILHRDLKPGNILLDSRGEPMVSDFGLAQRLDASSDTPRAAIIFGTPGFIAPEQASGDREQLTPAADIYSLGAILFDLLAGRPPFVGADALAVIRGAANEPAPRLRSFNPSLDTRLEMICAKCLERKPQARYHSADKLAKALERWLQPGS